MNQLSGIAIEAETPGDSATLFRMRIDDTRVGEHLTAAQAHLLIGEMFERIAIGAEPVPRDKLDHSNDDEAAAVIRAMWNPPPPQRGR
jgi:hypothetical protein